jgi:uncharacterized membrane protein SpoIIM required for sporulation
VLPTMATMAVTGYLFGLLSQNGLPVVYFLGFILPHGFLEIPAAMIASAAILKAGAILATPTPGKTVGEAWIESFAEWAKVMVGVVIPLLLAGAFVEAWVTPRLIGWLIR